MQQWVGAEPTSPQGGQSQHAWGTLTHLIAVRWLTRGRARASALVHTGVLAAWLIRLPFVLCTEPALLGAQAAVAAAREPLLTRRCLLMLDMRSPHPHLAGGSMLVPATLPRASRPHNDTRSCIVIQSCRRPSSALLTHAGR